MPPSGWIICRCSQCSLDSLPQPGEPKGRLWRKNSTTHRQYMKELENSENSFNKIRSRSPCREKKKRIPQITIQTIEINMSLSHNEKHLLVTPGL
ncbi:hypothetical protein O181_049738 [Austropuccinia psidii MF-1]|uniref:Uncharacterized protein n=1 Tax=Austropuccinia psidii MF-1 TaxID=1389203 RepID=A0A9Q3HLQ2_9BASI|nr:hypothetical protein [Austropuccinia psidii MF-1]